MSTTGFGAEPRPHPIARILTILLAIVLLAIAGVAIRDAWYLFDGAHPSDGWIATALNFLSEATVTTGGVIVGVLVAVLGLWLIISALRPRPHTHLKVRSHASIWMRPVDIARKSTAVVRHEFGADDISSRADRKKLTVNVAHDNADEEFISSVRKALETELNVLESTPKISVHTLPTKPREVQ
ncbi:alkaline shock response membrane anchor protein AmaP [Corynebacterium cystitidis]|uniref:alkaline shock response membrane anchor protein AmaP n=1 Tax=Corynebacterium cystitidis TaxID=35757 RepID=UPI00211E85FE|nr:alkaline shock response membrane anchor protein AmaP [Corynebacterium cystitidis]